MIVGGSNPLTRLVGDEVRSDKPSTTRSLELTCETVDAVLNNRVPIGHDENGDIDFLADRSDNGEHVTNPKASVKRFICRLLYHDAVHHGVGVWHTELEHVGAGLRKSNESVDAAVESRISRGEVTDKYAPPLGLRSLDCLRYRCHDEVPPRKPK